MSDRVNGPDEAWPNAIPGGTMTRTILVTGANRGIGKAIATALAGLGHRVIIATRNEGDGRRTAEEIGAEAVTLDVDNRASIEHTVDQLQNAGADVDVLINNAGVLFHRPVLDRPQDFNDCLSVMVHGPYHLIRLLAPEMVHRGYGRIVNVSSGWGAFSENLGGPGAYGVAKAALNAMTLALSRELPASVKVNAMCPGWVRTRMGGQGATRSPEEGADTAIWLATLPDNGPTGGFFRDRKPLAW